MIEFAMMIVTQMKPCTPSLFELHSTVDMLLNLVLHLHSLIGSFVFFFSQWEAALPLWPQKNLQAQERIKKIGATAAAQGENSHLVIVLVVIGTTVTIETLTKDYSWKRPSHYGVKLIYLENCNYRNENNEQQISVIYQLKY